MTFNLKSWQNDPTFPSYVPPRRLTKAEIEAHNFYLAAFVLIRDLEKLAQDAKDQTTLDGCPYRDLAEMAASRVRAILSGLEDRGGYGTKAWREQNQSGGRR